MLSIFPAMIVLLSVLAFFPIPSIDQALMDLVSQTLPPDTSSLLSKVVKEVTSQKKPGLLSFGL